MIHSSAYNSSSMGLVERSVRTLKEILAKFGNNLSQLQLSELVFAVNCRDHEDQGSAITRFLGRGVRGNLPNSLNRNVDWKEQVEARGETRQRRVDKKGRTVGKKETFEVGEKVRMQNIKSKKWDQEGEILDVRTAADGTIVSYEINTSGTTTTRHRRFLMKLHNSPVSNEANQTVDSDRDEQREESTAPERIVTRSRARNQTVPQ